ncbi:hypothetical protein [Streptomyces cyaneofuscatus]|uniref:hypothetical protein n=1 Tax=Streptomyces cyaneofuscatus TaxID=66883 RepID=UPI0033BA054F
MRLTDLRPLMARRRDGALSFDRFRTDPTVAALRWPDDVLEQFLFDHGDNPAFVDDYNTIDLHTITWQLETIPAAHFTAMPTGASDEGCIENYAENPVALGHRPAPAGRPVLGEARDVAAPAAPDRAASP